MFVEASLTASDERNEAHNGALALSEILIAELEAADCVLPATPKHNFTVPSVLKAWLDHVVRPRRTFKLTEVSKVGLLRDRPTWVVLAYGDMLAREHGGQVDFATPFLTYVFKSIGIADLDILVLEGLNRGDKYHAVAQLQLDRWLEQLSTTRAVVVILKTIRGP